MTVAFVENHFKQTQPVLVVAYKSIQFIPRSLCYLSMAKAYPQIPDFWLKMRL